MGAKGRYYWEMLSHLNIILGGMFVTFFIIDRFNPAMNFLTSELSRWMILALALAAAAQGVVGAIELHRIKKRGGQDR